MARVKRPEIGTEMYGVLEHYYYIAGYAGPVKEYCVCKGKVQGFITDGFTEIEIDFIGPDGYLKPVYYKLSDIGQKFFLTEREAAMRAKTMTEECERRWGWIGAPEFPMTRPWVKLL